MNAMKENEISTCIRKAIGGYLNDLDGEKPGNMYGMVINSVERPLIEIVMQHTNGNQTKAAELLGINRNTLRQKMKQHQIK
ncbi:Fis family transcriptional regulator [Nitrosomonas sp. JL21]|uniref:helix-turn-helix domain-containing protein n=1 Tax=Nitrosomonas sp. JL21 TaxID=153949 RepID=UPI001369041B|nr:helix-turn-helix domain-containing protein [Nitrosomonas sp. JL21]MBL8498892.1 Fis family transcriptional regulator [Nitrosomonas sp.]MCC7092375.1 Fis family transcriptional regulator [Nitrosomonas sp.]MXS77861.1 Fis family transcriptional regulator [Nitrosomonas sp. JL21]